MCGRARCTLNAAQVARVCGLLDDEANSFRTVDMDRFRPSYNFSPGSYLPVFAARRDVQGSQVGDLYGAVHCMKWGLIPSFTKKTEKPDHYRMFNARSESVKEKTAFRRLIPHNRCLVAVEGYYEWKKDGSRKQPYYIHFKDGRPLVLAALYDLWKNLEGEILYTFTILTTRSSSALEWLHDRMPLIFGSKDTIDTWLSNSPLKFEAVLTPYTDCDLVCYPVTPAMGKPSFEGPECIKEIQLKPSVQNQISKFFSKNTYGTMKKCKAEPEFIKSSDVFSINENPKFLMEESAMVDTKELVDEKRHEFDDSPSAKKGTVGPELCGIKRDLEEMGPDFEVKTELSDSYSKSVKRKLQSGVKQSSLLSYFGRN